MSHAAYNSDPRPRRDVRNAATFAPNEARKNRELNGMAAKKHDKLTTRAKGDKATPPATPPGRSGGPSFGQERATAIVTGHRPRYRGAPAVGQIAMAHRLWQRLRAGNPAGNPAERARATLR
eukprot:15464425-Alexandrium_andersonii.AAC.2